MTSTNHFHINDHLLILINIRLISHIPVVAMPMIEQVLIFASMCHQFYQWIRSGALENAIMFGNQASRGYDVSVHLLPHQSPSSTKVVRAFCVATRHWMIESMSTSRHDSSTTPTNLRHPERTIRLFLDARIFGMLMEMTDLMRLFKRPD